MIMSLSAKTIINPDCPRQGFFSIVFTYVVVAGLWILFSDQILAWLVTDPELRVQWSVCKGWLFVAVTAALLYGLILRFFKQLRQAHASLLESEECYRTQRKESENAQIQLETQLGQAQKMEAIGALAGGIAHDFNNMLGVIIPYVELAIEDAGDNELVKENLKEALKAANRAKDLVKQILTFSRHSKCEQRPMLIQPAVKETLKLLRSAFPATIDVRSNIPAELPPILADPGQIHQILMNLCTNALHAMKGKPGRLEVNIDTVKVDDTFAQFHADLKPGRYVRLRVSDSGHGMDSDTLKKIFEPFFTTKAPGEGTGLGLAVVHRIMKECHGGISVDSQPGRGSAFRLFFPVCDAAPDINFFPTADLPHENISQGKGERILLVDDEYYLARSAQICLQRKGYKVVSFNNPLDALAAFARNPQQFDMIVTDLTMPKMTGTELAENIRKINPAIPILLATGFNGDWTLKNVHQIGIQDLLLKPFTPASLSMAVHRAFCNKAASVKKGGN